MKSTEQEIIDLCSDDDNAKVSAASLADNTCSGNDPSDPENAVFKPYRKRKKQPDVILETASVAAMCQAGSEISDVGVSSSMKKASRSHAATVSPPLIFLNSDGMDNAIVTDGLMVLLRDIPNAVTCAGLTGQQSTMQHIQQHDKWSCGFRNLQMLFSGVLPLLPSTHSYYQQQSCTIDKCYISIPSLAQLQEILQQSWASGFDPKGADHYRHTIVGSSAQIGAVEVSNCLTFSGIENAVVQFIGCLESRSQLGPFCAAYFSKQHGLACPYCCKDSTSSHAVARRLLQVAESSSSISPSSTSSCPCPTIPLYLQWKGHSVSIVGVDFAPGGNKVRNLLIFDPIQKGSRLKDALLKRDLKPLRLAVSKLEKKDCQIIVTSVQTLSFEDKMRLKAGVNALTAAHAAVQRAMSR